MEGINEVEEKNEGTFGLLTFTNNVEFISFKNDITFLLNKGKYTNDNDKYIFNDDVCLCNIHKEIIPSWTKNVAFTEKINVTKNNTYYRIVLFKYSENIYFFERNGNICINDILDKYTFDCFTPFNI